MIIDSHAHITEESLRGDAPRIVADMKKDGLLAIIEVGCDIETSRDAVKIATENDNVFALVGTHPEFAEIYGDRERDYYLEAAKLPKVVGIGEIGLDYYYETPEREIQKRAFVAQLEMAHEAKLPISLHIRDAYGDLMTILKENRRYVQHGMLMHCYCGSKEFVKELAPFDSYFAFGGVVTFKNAKKDDIIRAVPKDRLVVETDCPYMTPVPFRGKRNEPKYVVNTAEYIAAALDMEYAEFEALTVKNTLDLFPKMRNFIQYG